MKAFWHKEANFGDRLTPWLLKKQEIHATWAPPSQARFFGCGSIADRIPEGYTGVVWGSGQLRARSIISLREAQVLAVRGPLTHEAGLYADPGLLCGLYAPEVEKRYKVGVLPHYIEALPHQGQGLNIRWKIEVLIDAAAKCERIISSSLHGLVLADSLGIPNMWVYSERVIGEGSKFRDYAASFGESIEPDMWRLAPQEQVHDKQQALIIALKGIPNG